jgi:hypothetical protein
MQKKFSNKFSILILLFWKTIMINFDILKIKIHQTSFRFELQNFKIDIDIAIEKPHNYAGRIHWVI